MVGAMDDIRSFIPASPNPDGFGSRKHDVLMAGMSLDPYLLFGNFET